MRRLSWETSRQRARPTTFMFSGQERGSGRIRKGMIAAHTKRSAMRALKRGGLRVQTLEPA